MKYNIQVSIPNLTPRQTQNTHNINSAGKNMRADNLIIICTVHTVVRDLCRRNFSFVSVVQMSQLTTQPVKLISPDINSFLQAKYYQINPHFFLFH